MYSKTYVYQKYWNSQWPSVLGICLYIYFQAGQMTQIGVLENLKMENVTLSHKLTETKHQSIKEKERIAVQLQSIEVWHTNTIFLI